MERKKLIIIGSAVAAILVIAAVATGVTLGVMNINKKNDIDNNNNNKNPVSSVEKLCGQTDYKETCVEAILPHAGNVTDPKELIKVAFKVAEDEIREVIKKSETIKKAEMEPRAYDAVENCKELLDYSINELKESIERIDVEFDMRKVNDMTSDLKSWLSAAMTYQQTCIDGFDNTTGDAGAQMKNFLQTSDKLTSNGLAMINHMAKELGLDDELPVGTGTGTGRRLLTRKDDFPSWVSNSRRKLLTESGPVKADVVVAQDGSGKYKTINEALKVVPKTARNDTKLFVIHIKAGVYKEYVKVDRSMTNLFLIGDGPTKTKITGNHNYAEGTATVNTCTVCVDGHHFMAKDIGFENTAGAHKHQAVALRVSSDQSILYNIQVDGFQASLYPQTHRQFYRDCTISGTVDFIFGDAAAVFQNCKMVMHKPESTNCMVTAQGRTDKQMTTGFVLQNCTITGSNELVEAKKKNPEIKAYLGRPWKKFSRTVVMQSHIDNVIEAEGWLPWAGTSFIDTLWYGEYKNRGPGADTSKRVKWPTLHKSLSPQEAQTFTAAKFINADSWAPQRGLPYNGGMLNI